MVSPQPFASLTCWFNQLMETGFYAGCDERAARVETVWWASAEPMFSSLHRTDGCGWFLGQPFPRLKRLASSVA